MFTCPLQLPWRPGQQVCGYLLSFIFFFDFLLLLLFVTGSHYEVQPVLGLVAILPQQEGSQTCATKPRLFLS